MAAANARADRRRSGAAVGEVTDGRVKVWSLPLDGSPRKLEFEDPESAVNGVTIDDNTGTLEGAWVGPDDHPIWFDKAE